MRFDFNTACKDFNTEQVMRACWTFVFGHLVFIQLNGDIDASGIFMSRLFFY